MPNRPAIDSEEIGIAVYIWRGGYRVVRVLSFHSSPSSCLIVNIWRPNTTAYLFVAILCRIDGVRNKFFFYGVQHSTFNSPTLSYSILYVTVQTMPFYFRCCYLPLLATICAIHAAYWAIWSDVLFRFAAGMKVTVPPFSIVRVYCSFSILLDALELLDFGFLGMIDGPTSTPTFYLCAHNVLW